MPHLVRGGRAFGEGCLGVATAIIQIAHVCYCLRLSQRGRWVLFISGANLWLPAPSSLDPSLESWSFLRVSRHPGAGLLGPYIYIHTHYILCICVYIISVYILYICGCVYIYLSLSLKTNHALSCQIWYLHLNSNPAL